MTKCASFIRLAAALASVIICVCQATSGHVEKTSGGDQLPALESGFRSLRGLTVYRSNSASEDSVVSSVSKDESDEMVSSNADDVVSSDTNEVVSSDDEDVVTSEEDDDADTPMPSEETIAGDSIFPSTDVREPRDIVIDTEFLQFRATIEIRSSDETTSAMTIADLVDSVSAGYEISLRKLLHFLGVKSEPIITILQANAKPTGDGLSDISLDTEVTFVDDFSSALFVSDVLANSPKLTEDKFSSLGAIRFSNVDISDASQQRRIEADHDQQHRDASKINEAKVKASASGNSRGDEAIDFRSVEYVRFNAVIQIPGDINSPSTKSGLYEASIKYENAIFRQLRFLGVSSDPEISVLNVQVQSRDNATFITFSTQIEFLNDFGTALFVNDALTYDPNFIEATEFSAFGGIVVSDVILSDEKADKAPSAQFHSNVASREFSMNDTGGELVEAHDGRDGTEDRPLIKNDDSHTDQIPSRPTKSFTPRRMYRRS